MTCTLSVTPTRSGSIRTSRASIITKWRFPLTRCFNFRHAGGQGKAVGRILKQRVSGNLHFVIMDARDVLIEPDRVGVTDKVHVMPAVGELQAELGGDNAAAAVGGIAGYSDSHNFGIRLATPIWPCRFSSGDATSPPPNQTR